MRQDCIDTFETKSTILPGWGEWAKAGLRMVKADTLQLVALPMLWHQRWHERRRLRELSDHTLKDTGLTRDQIDDMAYRPFWRP